MNITKSWHIEFLSGICVDWCVHSQIELTTSQSCSSYRNTMWEQQKLWLVSLGCLCFFSYKFPMLVEVVDSIREWRKKVKKIKENNANQFIQHIVRKILAIWTANFLMIWCQWFRDTVTTTGRINVINKQTRANFVSLNHEASCNSTDWWNSEIKGLLTLENVLLIH